MSTSLKNNTGNLITMESPHNLPNKSSPLNVSKHDLADKKIDAHRLDMLQTGKFSDYIIECRDKSFNVHRCFLFGASPFFNVAVDGGFKEAASQKLVLLEEESSTVWVVLNFVYLGGIDHVVWDQADHTTLARAYQLADFLDLIPLQASIFRILAEYATNTLVLGTAEGWGREIVCKYVTEMFDILCINSASKRLKELYGWVLTILNHGIDKNVDLNDKDIDSILETYPEIGSHMYRSENILGRQKIKCEAGALDHNENCDSLYLRRYVTVEVDGEEQWIKCCCQFRGFCSAVCLWEDFSKHTDCGTCTKCWEMLDGWRGSVGQRKYLKYLDGKIVTDPSW